MKSIILLVSVLLFLAEWYVIRKTSINKFAPIVVLAVIGVPVGSVIGLHLVDSAYIACLGPLHARRPLVQAQGAVGDGEGEING